MPHVRSPLFLLILATYLVAGGLYAWLTPAWQAPDEPAHYNYVHYLVTNPDFPQLAANCYNQAYLNELTSRRFPPDLSIDPLCYEFHQPPLYYLLGLPLFVLSDGWLPLLRFLSMAILGGGVVGLSFLIARSIFPDRPVIMYGAMALVAFTPMHLTMLASVNNDALAELILAVILLFLTERLVCHTDPTQHSRYFQSDLRLGVLLGLGLVTKTTVYIAIPLIAVVLWLTSRSANCNPHFRYDWRKLARQAFVVYGLALLIALPWYVRNVVMYGGFDILGLVRHDRVVVGQLRTADYIAQVGLVTYLGEFVKVTFESFWGQFGWMAVPLPSWIYSLLTALTLTALVGLVALWRGNRTLAATLSSGQRQALALLALNAALMALGYIWYNLTFVQFQGRYLFPALIPLGVFFALGLHEVLSLHWWRWLAGSLGIVLIGVTVITAWQGDLDRLGMLLIGLALAGVVGRAWLARYRLIPTSWLMAACYSVLALVTLVSPFWFIVPHLSP